MRPNSVPIRAGPEASSFAVHERDDILFVRHRGGALTGDRVDPLVRILHAATRRRGEAIVVDLRRAETVDTGVIAVLIDARRSAWSNDVDLRLAPCPMLRRLAEIYRVDHVLWSVEPRDTGR